MRAHDPNSNTGKYPAESEAFGLAKSNTNRNNVWQEAMEAKVDKLSIIIFNIMKIIDLF